MKTLRTLLTWGLLSAAAHVMGYSISVSPIEIEAGQTANLIINLDDAPDNFTAYQMMVYLPDGVTVQKKTNGKYAYTANADRHDGAFTVTVKDAADGSVLIACFSADKDVLTGTSGELIRLPLEVASTVTTSLQGSIKNIEFSDVNNNAYNPADVDFALTLKGGSTPPDVSGDVTVSVPDIEITAGSTADLIVNMQTELTNVTAYQLMVYLPDGVTVQKKTNGKYAYTANADRHDGNFTITVKDAADGSVLIACFSADKDVLTGTSGELIRLPLEVASTVTTSLQGSIKNIEFSDVNNNAYNPADVDFALTLKGGSTSQIITFADPAVKALCVANWDTDGDGELSEAEAAAVTDLGKVFKDNTEITSFNELQYFTGLTSIGFRAFYGCSSLTSITIPSSVTSIGDQSFMYCKGFTSLNLPDNLTSIGNVAFEDCSGLTSVNIPGKVTAIGWFAFAGCRLTSVFIPDSVTAIGSGAFCCDNSITSIKVGEGNKYFDSRNNCNAIIETATNKLIAACKNSFIPDGIKTIGGNAFCNCIDLSSITIPNSVTSIGEEAFAGTGLTFISIPNSVEKIVSEAFYGCENLTNVIIGNGVTSIGSRAFKHCSSLTDVYCYAENVPSTRSDAFENSSIASATLHVPAGSVEAYKATTPWSDFGTIVAIEDVAQNITFEDAAVKALCVANWDTNGDGKLSEAEAAAVTDLREVFKSNKEITSFNELQYFTGLTSIGNHAFYGCSALTSVIIPESVTSIDEEAFGNCKGLTSINIPESVTCIGDWAFESCKGLTSVIIPNSVTSIGRGAFCDCHILSITIGSGVTSIGEYAFSDGSGLQSIICYAVETPEVSENTFDDDDDGDIDISNVTLRVPRESVQKYKDHPVWGKFKIEVITGIDEVEDAMPKAEVEDAIYDLSGKAVNGNLPHGIYIRNGKKVAVK